MYSSIGEVLEIFDQNQPNQLGIIDYQNWIVKYVDAKKSKLPKSIIMLFHQIAWKNDDLW